MDVGTRLREARHRQGVTLRDISNITKIPTYMLESIERNDIARLPGGIFRRAYLRAYATAVGLDPEQVVRDYRAQCKVGSEEMPLELSTGGVEDSRLWSAWGLLLAAAAGLALVVQSSLFRRSAESPSTSVTTDRVPTIDESDVSGLLAPDATSVAASATVWSIQLEVRPRGVCWVSLVADGRRVIYRLMQPGEHALVEARDEIVLRVGDAGTFAYWINGAPGRPLGRPSQAVTIRITEDNYRTFVATAGPRAHQQVGVGTAQRAARMLSGDRIARAAEIEPAPP